MAAKTKANIYLVNLDTLEKLSIQFIPKEGISWEATSKWAVIPTVGRNNPFYHYTGGEDSLTFKLDWYSNDQARQDAIAAARIVRSWSRANAYRSKPPRIMLIFGDVFKNDVWIIDSAPFTMELFQLPRNMRPAQVYQDITLKKITSFNESHTTMRAGFRTNLLQDG